jgi:transcriptional regulator with XRE-family HTH domain
MMVFEFPNTVARRRNEERLAWYRDFGNRLRVKRLASGITEVEAAATCRISLRTYRKWEAGGRSRGGHSGLLAFAKKYDASLCWLFGGGGSQFDHYEGEPPSRPALTLVSDEKPA